MSDFKKRLEKECDELTEKVEKLQIFLTSEKVNEINPIQHDLLIIQLAAMTSYMACLGMRLNNLD